MSYGYSSLRLVQVPDASAWAAVRVACPSLTDGGVATLRSGLDASLRAVLVEPHYVCRDYRNLYSNFYSKKFVERSTSEEECAYVYMRMGNTVFIGSQKKTMVGGRQEFRQYTHNLGER